MNQKLVSIIIPFYNTGDSLIVLLAKLITDRYSNLEIICVDDASTDDSYAKISKFARDKKTITVLRNKHNGGSASARNLALKQFSGEYVIFVDSDDTVSDDFISEMVEDIEKSGAVLTTCGFCQNYLHDRKKVLKYVDAPIERKNGEKLSDYVLRMIGGDARLYSSVNKIFRGDIIRKNKLRFDDELNFAEDTKFVFEYLSHCDEDDELSFIEKPLYIYNYGTETSTVAKSSLLWRNWIQSYKTMQNWYGEKRSIKARFYFAKLLMRFKVSHALAVARSPLSSAEKKKYASGLELLGAKLLLAIKK